jgi:hypothetical protein
MAGHLPESPTDPYLDKSEQSALIKPSSPGTDEALQILYGTQSEETADPSGIDQQPDSSNGRKRKQPEPADDVLEANVLADHPLLEQKLQDHCRQAVFYEQQLAAQGKKAEVYIDPVSHRCVNATWPGAEKAIIEVAHGLAARPLDRSLGYQQFCVQIWARFRLGQGKGFYSAAMTDPEKIRAALERQANSSSESGSQSIDVNVINQAAKRTDPESLAGRHRAVNEEMRQICESAWRDKNAHSEINRLNREKRGPGDQSSSYHPIEEQKRREARLAGIKVISEEVNTLPAPSTRLVTRIRELQAEFPDSEAAWQSSSSANTDAAFHSFVNVTTDMSESSSGSEITSQQLPLDENAVLHSLVDPYPYMPELRLPSPLITDPPPTVYEWSFREEERPEPGRNEETNMSAMTTLFGQDQERDDWSS